MLVLMMCETAPLRSSVSTTRGSVGSEMTGARTDGATGSARKRTVHLRYRMQRAGLMIHHSTAATTSAVTLPPFLLPLAGLLFILDLVLPHFDRVRLERGVGYGLLPHQGIWYGHVEDVRQHVRFEPQNQGCSTAQIMTLLVVEQ